MDVKYIPLVEKLGLDVTITSCVVMISLAVMHGLYVKYGGVKTAEQIGKFYNGLLSLNGLRLATIVLTLMAVVILSLTTTLHESSAVAIISGALGYLFGNHSAVKSESGESRDPSRGKSTAED